jgi:hypothetical protein
LNLGQPEGRYRRLGCRISERGKNARLASDDDQQDAVRSNHLEVIHPRPGDDAMRASPSRGYGTRCIGVCRPWSVRSEAGSVFRFPPMPEIYRHLVSVRKQTEAPESVSLRGLNPLIHL